jgi:DNA repair protein RadD
MITLHDFQAAAEEEMRQHIRNRIRRILLVSSTGSGKGTICADMIHTAEKRGKRMGFIVHRREIVKDQSRRLYRLGVEHGIIMGDDPRAKPHLSTHVASVATLRRREIPKWDLVFIDEAHVGLPGYVEIINRMDNPIVIGMTATPVLLNGGGMNQLFQVMVRCPDTPELIERGFLAPPRVFAPRGGQIDVSDVKVTAGEFNQKQLAVAVDRPSITGDIVKHWLDLGGGRSTIGFAVNVEHSKHLAEQFCAAGIRAMHVDADTPDMERDRAWAGLASGQIKVVFNVDIAGIGWDVPCVSCEIDAQPTMSLARCIQKFGRVLRTHPGKDTAVILDHAGNAHRHGLPDEPRDWTLEGRKHKSGETLDRSLSLRTCKRCWGVFSARLDVCPHELPDGRKCLTQYVTEKVEISERAGELEEVKSLARIVCDTCKREMPGASVGDDCPLCLGTARRAYVIRSLSKNPAIAKLQQVAAEKAYKPGWLHYQIQKLGQHNIVDKNSRERYSVEV